MTAFRRGVVTVLAVIDRTAANGCYDTCCFAPSCPADPEPSLAAVDSHGELECPPGTSRHAPICTAFLVCLGGRQRMSATLNVSGVHSPCFVATAQGIPRKCSRAPFHAACQTQALQEPAASSAVRLGRTQTVRSLSPTKCSSRGRTLRWALSTATRW